MNKDWQRFIPEFKYGILISKQQKRLLQNRKIDNNLWQVL
jgi:hypothetical protein